MTFPLTLPSIGSTSWGTDVNNNWTTINGAFQTLAPFTGTVTITPATVSSGVQTALTVTGAVNTSLLASTEVNDLLFALNRTVQWATGALSTQRAVLFSAPTYAFVGSSTITTAATVAISGAPVAGTNASITTSLALWIQGGRSKFDGLLQTIASATGTAGLNVPHGTAPSSPVNGDVWTTSAGIYVQINGSTVGPLSPGGTFPGSLATNQVAYGSGTNTIQGSSTLTYSASGGLALAPTSVSSGVQTALTLNGAANTGLTTATEVVDINFNLARTVQWAAGALPTQRAALFQAPTYGFVSASTITNAATVAITGAPSAGTNATITNSWALWVQAGKVRIADTTNSGQGPSTGALQVAGGLSVNNASYLGLANNTGFIGNFIVGKQDGSALGSYQVGEVLTNQGGVTGGASGTTANLISLTLTPGRWMIFGTACVVGGTTGLTANSLIHLSVTTASGLDGAMGVDPTNSNVMVEHCVGNLVANGVYTLSTPPRFVNIASTTTYYLTGQATYASGTPTWEANITGVRIC